MKNRIKAQITVYAALSVILMLSLICTCIRSAAVSAQRAHMEAAVTLSLEAVFAGYSNQLLEEFDIFALKKTEALQPLFQRYAEKNIIGNSQETSAGNKNAEVMSAKLNGYVMMTDEGGQCINREILSYMQYGIYDELLEKMTNIKEEQQKAETIKTLTDSIVACETGLCEQEAEVLGIIQAVEGIMVDNSGIVIRNGAPVSTGSFFVKSALPGALSMQSAGINSSTVFQSVEKSPQYIDVMQLVYDMDENVSDYQQLFEEQEEAGSNSSQQEEYAKDYNTYYQRSREVLLEVLEGVSKMTQKALERIAAYEDTADSVLEQTKKCSQEILQTRTIVGEDIYQSLAEDVELMQEQIMNKKNTLCDINQIKTALEERERIVKKAESIQQRLNEPLEQGQCEQIRRDLKALQEVLQEIDNTSLVFDYSHVDFSEKKEGTKTIQDLYDKMTSGIMGLVIDQNKISEKEISVDCLAQEYIGYSSAVMPQEKNNILYNEYLFMKFASYTDYIREDGSFEKDTDKLLDYMVEYILYGEKSDQQNLSQSVTALSILREGINMAYLLTDSVKKREAEALATALAGFTGNMAVIKAAQYLILAVWAYGESILELQQLFQGKKVALIKTKDNWRLSLERLLQMDFNGDELKENEEQGMSYEDYLRACLLIEPAEKKYYLTMSAMELRMIELGTPEFRMKDYIYQMEGQVLYKIPLIGQYYERAEKYSYG